MWIKHDFFKYITGTILVLICLYFLSELGILKPIKTVIRTLFFPILIAGFIYYLLKPIVRLLRKIKFIPDLAAIFTVYAAIIAILYGAYRLLAGTIQKQAGALLNDLPKKLKETAEQAEQMIKKNNLDIVSVQSLQQKAASYLSDLTQHLSDHFMQVATTIAGAATVLVVVPFIVFYFLKDDNKLSPYVCKLLPMDCHDEGQKILRNISETLSAYIIGQVIVACVDGVLMYIAYLIIGVHYAMVLAIFVIVTAVIPFFGPVLGLIPAIVVALTQDPIMILYIIIAAIVVQQLEGNLVAPAVLGNRLDLHPLTIILLLIVAGALYGFIGVLIAVPLFASLKVTVKNLYHFYQLRKRGRLYSEGETES